MATKPKAILSTHDGREASPITKASNVLFENGQTAQDILNDRQDAMISPVIENSSSMFKVGQGDNVDYSSNVVNGAYESMVLKGKSMVNCIQEPSSKDVVLPYEFEECQYVTINDTKESGALGVELKGQTLVNLCKTPSTFVTMTQSSASINLNIIHNLQANKKYAVIGEISEINAPNKGLCTWVTHADGTEAYEMKRATNKGRFFFTCNVTKEIKTFRVYIHGDDRDNGGTITIGNLMLLEYQEGMENWDIPYFEGMTSCKMPILHTVGKNLYEGKDYQQNVEANKSTGDLPLIMRHVKLKKNTDYCISYSYETNTTRNDTVYGLLTKTKVEKLNRHNALYSYHHEGYEGNGQKGNSKELTQARFNTGDFEYLYFGVNSTSAGQNGYIKYYNIQLEESSSPTTYESHKSSILSLPEEVVLRSLPNGVCDTFNTRTGVYTQRIKEKVLNGGNSESWVKSGSFTGTSCIRFQLSLSDAYVSENTIISITNDKFPNYPNSSWQEDVEQVNIDISNRMSLNILKTKLTSEDVSGLRAWLSQNPTTICYELETPIITKINLPSTLKSWNTTTHIYSEIPENTLYPTLSHSNPTYPVIIKPSTKYSIVANSYSNGHTNSAINFNLGGATVSTTVGNRVTTITTPSTLSNELLTMSGRGNKLNNVMVIEGDVAGDEPYFEGMCDSKSPTLTNVGLTLFESPLEKVYGEDTTREFFNMMDLAPYVDKWGINKNYTFSFDIKANKSGTARIYFQNGNGSRHNLNINVPVTTEYVRHTVTTNISGTDHNWKESRFACFTTYDTGCFATIKNIQFALGTSVEPYKSNATTFDQKDDKTIVLRSLPNGVCDTLNVETGEYVKRIGEVVLDGSTNLCGTQMGVDNHIVFYIVKDDFKGKGRPSVSSDNFPTYSVTTFDKRGMFGESNGERHIWFILPYNLLKTNDLQGALDWLRENPTTVQYELETPIIKTVDLSGFPFSYENGHVILSSGSIEQSLTPKVEYSVATNRNGQIRSNQKMVERHQKQLDQLQAIILANLVNSQYNQTLTTLKYELSRV